MEDYTPALTPVERHGGILVKRDDAFCLSGVCGGKVRACWTLATMSPGAALGLITASARKSPQAQIVARLAARLGIPARCHMPAGAYTEEMYDVEAHGGIIVQHKAGYNNVIIARAQADAGGRVGWRYIPFGMEHPAAVACTRGQVANIPSDVERIVICIGSGMSVAGVLYGLRDLHRSTKVLGIRVGADPVKRLRAFGPFAWHEQLTVVDITGAVPYHSAVSAQLGDLVLDPHYEAKCLEYVGKRDMFWVIGKRATTSI